VRLSFTSSSKPLSLFNETLIKYTLVPSIPLSIIAVLSINPTTWPLSEIHHFYIELFAVILAAILSFYYISRYHTLNDKFSLFLGIGFLVNALIDLLHVIVSYNLVNEPLFLKYFIPQTWFAGRLFLSAMFAMAIACYPILSRNEQEREESQHHNLDQKMLVVFLAVIACLAAGTAISSLFIFFPGIVLDNYPLHRPYEIPPLILFLVALFYFYKRQLYKKNDVFYKGIVGSILIDAFAELIMSYSTASFDTAHNVAHILKDSAYFVNIVGLALSSINYNLRLKESNDSLEEINARLREREELIRIQYERLKESDKMKNEFINVASHELRTPIQPILTLSAVLRLKIQDVRQQELLDIIIRNAKRLMQLTESILDVTKMESQSLILKKERFDLNDIVINVMNDITLGSEFINNKNIRLSYMPQHILLEADRVRIIQVISNMLANAVKFTKEGTITITSEIKDSAALVSVKDTGQGLHAEVLPQLFTKFGTKSPSHGVQKGTGLGLFISKNIIEAHGGKIWAENNMNGNGATFTFSVPLREKVP
jgi:signal transduction histidine kinase